ncbi:protoglobin domain-containing protein [Haloarchaeobius sp. DYHT-AS-18]|uniref:protoglobin domain-containing protein n=1 Tax=Haloarchaeobius sp. DYHT-AS-18 TaxID=3446117 RepID=UPI003EBD3DF7
MQPEQEFGQGGLNRFVDAATLVEDIGLDAEEVRWRKEFIGFDGEDERRLADLEPLLREHQDAIADDFYENLLQYDQTRAVIERSPKGVEMLKQTQRAYLVSLATGEYDQQYFANRARIGKLHEILDMPLKHYVGQYGVYYDLILSEVDDRVQGQVVDAIEQWAEERDDDAGGGLGKLVGALGFGDEAADGLDESFEATVREAIHDGMQDVLALLRIINLDLQVATDTYVDSYSQRLERAIERREQLAHEVELEVQSPVEELHEASSAVSKSAQAISDLTGTQAAQIQATAGELDEVSAAAEEVASVADEVRTESERTEALAADGADAADGALDSLAAIEEAAAQVEAAASTLEARTDDIDQVVDRIDSLAERTAVLATNANIEATRADATSDTLSVIATEVKSFAEKAQADLDEIEEAVEGVREATTETVETVDETAEQVEAGTDQVRETVTHLDEIHESARATAAGMDDVAAAADQQAESVETLATSVEQVASAADRVASEAESVAAASEEQTANVASVEMAVHRLTESEGTEETPVYEQFP